jgi:hypothetical protein
VYNQVYCAKQICATNTKTNTKTEGENNPLLQEKKNKKTVSVHARKPVVVTARFYERCLRKNYVIQL